MGRALIKEELFKLNNIYHENIQELKYNAHKFFDNQMESGIWSIIQKADDRDKD